MNLKVGDKVTIRQWDDMAEEFGVDYDGDIKCKNIFISDMRKYCGKTFTIVDIEDYLYPIPAYVLSDDSGTALKDSVFSTPWTFTEDMFEKKTAFTKENLKSGMVVEYANGERRLVVDDVLLANDTWAPLEHFENDLTHFTGDMTINAVYEKRNTPLASVLSNPGELLWKREEAVEMAPEEAVEMTLEEVCKELGKNIKIVK